MVVTAKNAFVGFVDERVSDTWDWGGHHIEGYLNGSMCKFAIWSMLD